MSAPVEQKSSESSGNCGSCGCESGCGLLLWKNPIETGKVFGGLLVGLLVLKTVNLITFFLKVFYTTLFISGSIEFVSKIILGKGLVTKYGLKDCPNVVGMIKPSVDHMFKVFPVYQAKFRKLVFAYQPKNNFKAAVILFVLHRFFSWFSVWTIAFIGVISTFTVPLIYSMYKKEIDTAVDNGIKVAKVKTDEFTQLASEKTKPYLETLDSKLGPVSGFVKSQYHNANTVSSKSTTTGLAAKVPLEEPSKGTTTGSTSFPSVPQTAPLNQQTQEFSVDALQSELKQSTDGLKRDLQENNNVSY
ncbi:hypothetical protein HG535_0F05010 [Zygotorulaspora mrakii]|uniref:Reticulon-like protein n=1 Tax=Zygotorulaspora mrakii TaxID=42260 RepID=A0A7H9B7M9_ZYGMR|nr:uncharacterized protein HG535_0F05010 [Zygotorulaspora mrakii]QLG73989.1 hypothetical protein HG535_0F05010 [Zygotorulaspora mrakii]